MDTSAFAAIRGLVEGLRRAGIIPSSSHAETIANAIEAEAVHFDQIGHTEKAAAIRDVAGSMRNTAKPL